MQNGFIKSFNDRVRDNFLNETLFFDLYQARRKIAAWTADFAGVTHAGRHRVQSHRTRRDRLRKPDQFRTSRGGTPEQGARSRRHTAAPGNRRHRLVRLETLLDNPKLRFRRPSTNAEAGQRR